MRPRGSIVQITKETHPWFPCLVIVSEVKSSGVQGYITIPRNDGEKCENAYIRLNNDEFEPVGKAAIVVEGSS